MCVYICLGLAGTFEDINLFPDEHIDTQKAPLPKLSCLLPVGN